MGADLLPSPAVLLEALPGQDRRSRGRGIIKGTGYLRRSSTGGGGVRWHRIYGASGGPETLKVNFLIGTSFGTEG